MQEPVHKHATTVYVVYNFIVNFVNAGDFRLSSTLVNFAPNSLSGTRQCVQFMVMRDAIVERNETMVFQASSLNPADSFVGSTNTSITIFDDDGT